MPTSNDIGLFHRQMNKNSVNTAVVLDTFGNNLMVAMVQGSTSKLLNLIAGVKTLGLTDEQLKQICQNAAEMIPGFKQNKPLISLKTQELFTLVREGVGAVQLPVEPPNLYSSTAVTGWSELIVSPTETDEKFNVGEFGYQLSEYFAQYWGDFVVPEDQRDDLMASTSIAEERIRQLLQDPNRSSVLLSDEVDPMQQVAEKFRFSQKPNNPELVDRLKKILTKSKTLSGYFSRRFEEPVFKALENSDIRELCRVVGMMKELGLNTAPYSAIVITPMIEDIAERMLRSDKDKTNLQVRKYDVKIILDTLFKSVNTEILDQK